MKYTKIMLIEDHPEYREVVELTLVGEPDLKLISQFGTAERALSELQSSSPDSIPDIILLDLNLPGMSGIEAISWILKYQPQVKIIVLTQSDQEADVYEAVKFGAVGYLLKSSHINVIKQSIRDVRSGGAVIDPGMAKFILGRLQKKPKKVSELKKPLSDRELEILRLIADGLLKKEIAIKLRISPTTVITHVSHIYEKLNATNAPAAINIAYKNGIL